MSGPRARFSLRQRLAAGVLVLAAVAVGLQQLAGSAPRTDPLPETATIEPAPLDVRRCPHRDPVTVAEIRGGLAPRPRISSAAVQSCPAAFDRLQVRYVGELIGDLLVRQGGAWVLVNDDPYALAVGPLTAHHDHRGTNSGLSVWLPTELLGAVGEPGRPGRRGEVVEVVGVLLRADPQDGGGLTLRASQVTVLHPSVTLEPPLDVPQLVVAVVVSMLSIGAWLLRRRSDASPRSR